MTARAWLLLGFLLIISFSAFAETIPATSNPGQSIPARKFWGYPAAMPSWNCLGAQYQTNVCVADMANSCHPNRTQSGWSPYTGTENATTHQCQQFAANGTSVGGIGVNYACDGNGTLSGTMCVNATTYSCPIDGGWTLEGQSCTRSNCAAQKGTVANSGFYDMGTSASASFPAVGCYSGCSAVFEGDAPSTTSIVNGTKHYYAEGQYVYDEFVCSGTTSPVAVAAAPANTCSSTQDGGYVNGKFTCVNKATQQPEPTDVPKTETKTTNTTNNPDGSTTITTTTNHPDGTKTIVTTTTAPDGTKTETVVTDGGESENPQDGSATEATQKEILDELKKTECEKNPDSFACVTSPLDIVNVDLPESVVNVSITPISVGGAGSCPADHVVDFIGQPVTVSWQLPCKYATGIRPVVLAVAWLSAALILIGAFRQEG